MRELGIDHQLRGEVVVISNLILLVPAIEENKSSSYYKISNGGY
jgi:hypothetical protein